MQKRVVVKEPNKEAKIIKIDMSLATLQEIVDGWIEYVYPYEADIAVICNEEGKLRGLEPNIMTERYGILYGTIIVCERTGKDLGKKLAEEYVKILNDAEV